MAGGEELSAPVDIGVSGRKSARGGRGSTQRLTADRTKGLVSLGASSLLRIERQPSAAVEDEDDGVEAMQSFLRGLAWWGGRGGRGGAPGLLKGTREGPWPRWCKSAAAGAFGDEREEEQRRGMSSVGEGRGTRGFGGVRGKVLGVSVARIRTKGGLQREAGGGRGSWARATPRSF